MGSINTGKASPSCILYDETSFDQSPEKVLERTRVAANFGRELKTLKPYPIAFYNFTVNGSEIGFVRPAAKAGSPPLTFTQQTIFSEENGKQYLKVITTENKVDPNVIETHNNESTPLDVLAVLADAGVGLPTDETTSSSESNLPVSKKFKTYLIENKVGCPLKETK